MDFAFTDEQRALRERVVAFAQGDLNEDNLVRDRSGTFAHDAWKRCAEFGIQSVAVPAAYNASGVETDLVTAAMVMEALGYGCRDNGLNMALAAHMELHRGKWAIALDPMWAQLEMDMGDEGSAEVNISLIELWGSYKLTPNWEILGGARFQEQDIDVEPGLPSPPFPESVGVKEDWLDWFLGARFAYMVAPKWQVVGRGDVTLAGDSDKGYSASFFLNRKIRKTMMFNLGYRYMKTEYDNDVNYAWDVAQHGPVIGYTWSF